MQKNVSWHKENIDRFSWNYFDDGNYVIHFYFFFTDVPGGDVPNSSRLTSSSSSSGSDSSSDSSSSSSSESSDSETG